MMAKAGRLAVWKIHIYKRRMTSFRYFLYRHAQKNSKRKDTLSPNIYAKVTFITRLIY